MRMLVLVGTMALGGAAHADDLTVKQWQEKQFRASGSVADKITKLLEARTPEQKVEVQREIDQRAFVSRWLRDQCQVQHGYECGKAEK